MVFETKQILHEMNSKKVDYNQKYILFSVTERYVEVETEHKPNTRLKVNSRFINNPRHNLSTIAALPRLSTVRAFSIGSLFYLFMSRLSIQGLLRITYRNTNKKHNLLIKIIIIYPY